jgi:hypothetical protein
MEYLLSNPWGVTIKPLDLRDCPEPGALPFGKLTRAQDRVFQGLLKAILTCKVATDFSITQGFQERQPRSILLLKGLNLLK